MLCAVITLHITKPNKPQQHAALRIALNIR